MHPTKKGSNSKCVRSIADSKEMTQRMTHFSLPPDGALPQDVLLSTALSAECPILLDHLPQIAGKEERVYDPSWCFSSFDAERGIMHQAERSDGTLPMR